MPAPLIEQAATEGYLTQALAYLIGVIGSLATLLAGVLWKNHNNDIAGLKAGLSKLSSDVKELGDKMDTRVDLEVFNKTEDRLRTGIIDLHRKIEESSSDLYRKIDENERSATNRHIELLNALRDRR